MGPEWGSSQAGALEELRLMLSRPAVGRSGSAVALARTAQLWGHPNSFVRREGKPKTPRTASFAFLSPTLPMHPLKQRSRAAPCTPLTGLAGSAA